LIVLTAPFKGCSLKFLRENQTGCLSAGCLQPDKPTSESTQRRLGHTNKSAQPNALMRVYRAILSCLFVFVTCGKSWVTIKNIHNFINGVQLT